MNAAQESTQPIPNVALPLTAMRELQPGDMVGEYQIEGKLGQGAMGAVYAAVHPIIDKRVALKLLRRDLCANRDVLNRFIQEARAVNRIRHRNIVDVFGFGKAPDGRAFLAMELLEGTSLATHLEQFGALEVPEAVALLVEITHALEAAHRCGVVHRDLKPDNVFLAQDRDGRRVVKLLDFGIAKLLGKTDRSALDRTLPGTTMGTPEYMAPEQAQGHEIDCSADVYALGVMAFKMFTGRLPFESASILTLIAHHISTPPPAPSTFGKLPAIADRLLLAMLDKQPANRPSLERVRAQLDELSARCQGLPVVSSRLQRTTAELVAVVRRPRWPRIALAVASIAVMVGVGWWARAAGEVAPSVPYVELPSSSVTVPSAVAHDSVPTAGVRRSR